MALGDNYASLTELKSELNISDTTEDTKLTNALTAASRSIDHKCQRQFNLASSATARKFYAYESGIIYVDDFTSITTLKTDDNDDGTFETTWTSADYQTEPLNGVVNGESGWPYWKIRAVDNKVYPWYNNIRASVELTAIWGWSAVPLPVKRATLILAEELFKLKDAPFGVAGFGAYGMVRVRDNPKVCSLIDPYRRDVALIA